MEEKGFCCYCGSHDAELSNVEDTICTSCNKKLMKVKTVDIRYEGSRLDGDDLGDSGIITGDGGAGILGCDIQVPAFQADMAIRILEKQGCKILEVRNSYDMYIPRRVEIMEGVDQEFGMLNMAEIDLEKWLEKWKKESESEIVKRK